MASVEISSLYHRRRLLNTSIPWTLGLLLYTPFGIVLTVVRLFLVLQLVLFLKLVPKSAPLRRWWFRGIQPGLGFVVTTEGFERRKPDSPKVLVSNHVTLLDHVIMESLVPCLAVRSRTHCPRMHSAMSHGSFTVTESPDALADRVRTYVSDEDSLPVLIHPENGCTTGTALMAFKHWPFSVQRSVQPITIASSRPFPLAPHFYGSTVVGDLLYFLFTPFTKYHVRLLPTVTRNEDESVEDFAARVQQLMASSLQVPASQHTRYDITERVKRLRQDERQSQSSGQPYLGGGLPEGPVTASGALSSVSAQDQMVRQVHGVFPHAPYLVVARDLAQTKSVDETITNILEGRLLIDVPVAAASSPAKQTSSKTTHSGTRSRSSTATSAEIPTFEERRQQLIKEARVRFLKRTAS